MSSLPQSAEMPKGCLFPDPIPNRDVSQRYLAQLTREGYYEIGGFHCLLPKDRINWGDHYIVHVHYIHVRSVVKEVNKGSLVCAPLRSCYCHFYLPKHETDPLSGESRHENQKRSTTTTTMTIETPQK